MKLLPRTALLEFITYFIFAIVVLAFILLMDRLFLLADLLVRKGVPIATVGEIALFSLPFVISISTPLGGLIGGVITYGRMAQDNELGVVRSAGVPAWRVFLPVLFLSSTLVIVMVFFNGYLVPETQHQVRNLLTDIARKKPALRIKERMFMDDFPGYMVYIGAIDERHSTISNVLIFERSRGGRPPAFITAPRGVIKYTPDDRYLVLTLYDGEVHDLLPSGNYRRLSFREQTINILNEDRLTRQDREYRSNDEMSFASLIKQINEINREVATIKERLSVFVEEKKRNGQQLVRFEEFETKLRYRRQELNRLLTELQKRLSLAFSCLFFVLFGVPLGVLLRRGGVGTGFVVGLVFFAIYYVLLLAGENFAENGKISPFLGMWLPNLILLLPVIELFLRAFFEFSLLRMLTGLKV